MEIEIWLNGNTDELKEYSKIESEIIAGLIDLRDIIAKYSDNGSLDGMPRDGVICFKFPFPKVGFSPSEDKKNG